MLKGKRLLAVVPARGGSKGIPLKNLRPLGGVPLVARVGHLVKELGYLDRAIVSTDSSEIARVAIDSGLEAPFFRPPELCEDEVGDLEVLTHALTEIERADRCRYDVVVMLQPTSPLRKPEHVTATVVKLIDGGWDTVWTVSPTDSKSHPWKQLSFENEVLTLWDPRGRAIVARQQLSQVYHRNGAAYVFTRECLLEQRTIMGKRWTAIVTPEPMVSIDTPFDLECAEWLLARAGRDREGRTTL